MTRSHTALEFLLAINLAAISLTGHASEPPHNPTLLGDVLWVWATPDRTVPGKHDLQSFAEASGATRAEILGVPNVILAGSGLPNDDEQAKRWTQEVAHCPRLVWEIAADGNGGPPFVYSRRIAQLAQLVRQYPRIEGVLLDDMSSIGIDKGFLPEHIAQIRQLLKDQQVPAKIWGVLYTMNFDRANIEKYVEQLDVISLWVWHAKDLVNLEKHVAYCQSHFPGKPIVLGLYLRDYGQGRRMPQDLMQSQCETARRLALAGKVQGLVFLTIDNDPEIVRWTADWIRSVAQDPLKKAARGKYPSTHTWFVSQAGESAADKSARSRDLHVDDAGGWHFVGGKGPWTESQGVIRPPDERSLHSRAFYTGSAYGDFVAEFEFNGDYRETGTGAAAFILRARDVNHGYMVYFPWGGQQLRAKNFWAHLMKVDGNGYLQSLKSAWVPGVPSETDRWYRVRVEAAGPSLTVLIDGRKALSVNDTSFSSGAVGLAGYGWYGFRNVKIDGTPADLPAWDRSQTIPVHSFTVGLDGSQMPSGCVAPNGEVLLAAGNRLVRSTDRGRTWGQPETLPEKLGTVTDYGNTMFRTASGRLIVQIYRDRGQTGKDVPEVLIADSPDNGHTWSEPLAAQVAGGWPGLPAKPVPYGPLVQTQDGTLLRFLLGSAAEGSQFKSVVTWGAVHCKAFAIRSTDDGKSWSGPIEIDQPSWVGQPRGSIPGSLDLTEPTGVAIGNRVTVLIRPVYSPYMWQCWSQDAGATWDAASRTTFPGYAQSIARTRSGAIVCAHRYPQYSVNVSRDDGLNWDDGTVIDTPVWAMGCVVEVEPEVLLCTYMNAQRANPLLAQLVRVTAAGIEPVKP